jgi:hypothetical protein
MKKNNIISYFDKKKKKNRETRYVIYKNDYLANI